MWSEIKCSSFEKKYPEYYGKRLMQWSKKMRRWLSMWSNGIISAVLSGNSSKCPIRDWVMSAAQTANCSLMFSYKQQISDLVEKYLTLSTLQRHINRLWYSNGTMTDVSSKGRTCSPQMGFSYSVIHIIQPGSTEAMAASISISTET